VTARTEALELVVGILAGYWKFQPNPAELAALHHETKNWSDLTPLVDAARHATAVLDDRPSISWLMREANRRRPQQITPTRRGCRDCRGARWIDDGGPAGPPVLRHCPTCNPIGAELQSLGAYDPDAPTRANDPRFQAAVDRWLSEPQQIDSTKFVLLAADTTPTAEQRQRRRELDEHRRHLGHVREAWWRWLRTTAHRNFVELPTVPVGGSFDSAVEALLDAGVDVDLIVLPSVDEVADGEPIPWPPGHNPGRQSDEPRRNTVDDRAAVLAARAAARTGANRQ
jgi:hypothetical protein